MSKEPSESTLTFWETIKEGDVETVRNMLVDVDPTAKNNRALSYAVFHGHTEIVKLLLGDGRADPSIECNIILRLASSRGHEDIVTLLLEDSRVDLSLCSRPYCCHCCYGGSPLYSAIISGRTKIVKIFLDDSRIDPSMHESRSLRKAVSGCHVEIVELLLEDGRVNPKTHHNFFDLLEVQPSDIKYAKKMKMIRALLGSGHFSWSYIEFYFNPFGNYCYTEVTKLLQRHPYLVSHGEWRSRKHPGYPVPYRQAMRTLMLLAKT